MEMFHKRKFKRLIAVLKSQHWFHLCLFLSSVTVLNPWFNLLHLFLLFLHSHAEISSVLCLMNTHIFSWDIASPFYILYPFYLLTKYSFRFIFPTSVLLRQVDLIYALHLEWKSGLGLTPTLDHIMCHWPSVDGYIGIKYQIIVQLVGMCNTKYDKYTNICLPVVLNGRRTS